jgi:hypothetical protein
MILLKMSKRMYVSKGKNHLIGKLLIAKLYLLRLLKMELNLLNVNVLIYHPHLLFLIFQVFSLIHK